MICIMDITIVSLVFMLMRSHTVDSYVGLREHNEYFYVCEGGGLHGWWTLCDGRYDNCADGSDENTTNCEPCASSRFRCDDSQCIDFSNRCDDVTHCHDGSDELSCTTSSCPIYLYRCDNGQCIHYEFRCDGGFECVDSSDEDHCNSSSCPAFLFGCDSGQCVGFEQHCDGKTHCLDGTDEADCVPCEGEFFQCAGSHQCLAMTTRCNGRDDCEDRSDEIDCRTSTCPAEWFRCDSGQCIQSYSLRCDGHLHCRDGSDEDSCEQSVCPGSWFRCESGQCLPSYTLRCDGAQHCTDGSDEANCEVSSCPIASFRCQNGQCIQNISQRCDEHIDCKDGSDEFDCVSCDDETLYCDSSHACLPLATRCNGEDDCGDGSDEAQCGSSVCPVDWFRCDSGQCIRHDRFCNGMDDCTDASDEQLMHCMWESGRFRTFVLSAVGVLSLVLVATFPLIGLYCCLWRRRSSARNADVDDRTSRDGSLANCDQSSLCHYDDLNMYERPNPLTFERPSYEGLVDDPYAYNYVFVPGENRVLVHENQSRSTAGVSNGQNMVRAPEMSLPVRVRAKSLPDVLEDMSKDQANTDEQCCYITMLQQNVSLPEKVMAGIRGEKITDKHSGLSFSLADIRKLKSGQTIYH